MPLRVECTTPGLEANWIEVDEVWAWKEFHAFTRLSGDEYWRLWGRKVTACHVELVDGGAVTDPTAVQVALDGMDMRLVRWLPSAVLTATSHLLNLGEGSARLLSNGVGVAVPTKRPTAVEGTTSG